jgi:hypothetical protein
LGVFSRVYHNCTSLMPVAGRPYGDAVGARRASEGSIVFNRLATPNMVIHYH